MPGKFINTVYKDTMDSLISIHDDLIKNPFYLFNDKKGVKVRYFNQNMEKSTIDKGSGLAYADIGDESPIRYNQINNLFLYQFPKIELNFDNGEFGLESEEISGESYILPNTIIPYDGDFFEVDHIKDSTWLFKVIGAQRDTLENGSNVYKINWILDRTTNKDILKNVNDEDIYEYLDVREGTNVKAVVKKTSYDKALELDNLASSLRDYFIDLFYSKTVQTFVFEYHAQASMYDPFLIEFILRNKLLERDGKDFVYVEHKLPLDATFHIEYSKTFYYAFEKKDIKKLANSIYQSQADYIDSPMSIFSSWYGNYYEMNYKIYLNEINNFNPKPIIPILEEELIERVLDNKKYDDKPDLYKNIFIKFFNNEDIYNSDIECINYIDYGTNKDIFYHIILLIFCIDYYTRKLLS